ncbi:MAG: hypothetical protein M1817_004874 [Caeruleum heppii]|nr:MAG: hypothetical protein M1817_004874 [Caeruleum heppii]
MFPAMNLVHGRWSSSISSSLLLLGLLSSASAVFDPSNPPIRENFDPAEADPIGNITCTGPLPPWPLPNFPDDDWDPNTFTLQELCAKPQYGGRAKDQHLAGFCEEDMAVTVGFDYTNRALSADHLMSPRNPSARFRDIDEWPTSSLAYIGSADEAWQLTVEHTDICSWYDQPVSLEEGGHDVLVTAVSIASELDLLQAPVRDVYYDPARYKFRVPITLDPSNNISCSGPFPPWPIPIPFAGTTWDIEYEDLQDLCAIQLAGGHLEANAGMYCHRIDVEHSVPWFTDELTPRLEWTLENYPLSLSLRMHCLRHCRCQNSQILPDSSATVWPIRPGAQVVMNKASGLEVNGSMELRVASENGRPKTVLPILPAVTAGIAPAAGTCGQDKREFCSQAWPSDILGPTPTAPLGVSASTPPAAPSGGRDSSPSGGRAKAGRAALMKFARRPPSRSRPASAQSSGGGAVDVPTPRLPSVPKHRRPTPAPQLPTCGSACQSNRDCRVGDEATNCRCLAVGEPIARQAGLDPVFPSALCLVFSAALPSILAGYAKSLPRRSEVGAGTDDETASKAWGCACNATYVSQGCCDRDDGRVWEAADQRLGRLAI